MRIALLGSVVVSLGFAWADSPAVVAGLVLIAGLTYGGFYTPGMALLTDAAERQKIAPGLAFGAMNGALGGRQRRRARAGRLARRRSPATAVPYLLLALVCLLTFAVTMPWAPGYLQARSRPSSS